MESPELQLDSNPELEIPSTPVFPRRSHLRLILILLLVVGGGFGLWHILARSQESPPAAAQQPPMPVKTLLVKTSPIEESSEFVANLQSRRSVTLRPRIQGQVTQILVRSGEQVNADTPILKIDAKQQQASVESRIAAVESSQADLATAQAEVTSAQADAKDARAVLKALQARRVAEVSDVTLSQREYERFSYLYREGAISLQIIDQRRNALEVAKAKIAQTDADIAAQGAAIARTEAAITKAQSTIIKNQRLVKQAQANVKEQAVQLQFYTIAAPFAGTVGDIPVKMGDFVDTSTPLTTITENRLLEVNFSVPNEQALQLHSGMSVELTDGQGRKIGTSRIFFISPKATNDTQSVLVKSLFDNSRGQLRVEQFVRAKVIWKQQLGVLVPTTAIMRFGGETFVFVAEPSESGIVARQRLIKLGSIEGNNYQVITGLKPEEKVVVSGLLALRDGAPITPQ
ncbi:efflux transporter periplasmic adaptor subunit [[Phormidium ambiguum] IAM M-71]|uniref:Efflux transporter periplasmic adaptor subunit n=1 Tax=[Phormidium ambiguum] IAM M-71 TaxID=454136 RepID=A0A1U7IGN7_9CYAN|nr:efflux RND transporter periplasmic adaptor subunit [Phormidium ambiguum]OKH36165.1 efflux transporter periplasmic adaptor subunit [Phormidium ambiguum IAM M-71]